MAYLTSWFLHASIKKKIKLYPIVEVFIVIQIKLSLSKSPEYYPYKYYLSQLIAILFVWKWHSDTQPVLCFQGTH